MRNLHDRAKDITMSEEKNDVNIPQTEARGDKVTCRSCRLEYVPSPFFDFYPDKEDSSTGLCEECFLAKIAAPKTPPQGHVDNVCKKGQGKECCAYLVFEAKENGGFRCSKESSMASHINQRLAENSMRSKGDNCSGPPHFIPNSEGDTTVITS